MVMVRKLKVKLSTCFIHKIDLSLIIKFGEFFSPLSELSLLYFLMHHFLLCSILCVESIISFLKNLCMVDFLNESHILVF